MPRNFTAAEVYGLKPKLILMLDDARDLAKTSFVISKNGGFRSGDPKAHGLGKAVDLKCSTSNKRRRMVKALLEVGFKRIGVYDRHIHADIARALEGEKRYPQNVMWWGKSK